MNSILQITMSPEELNTLITNAINTALDNRTSTGDQAAIKQEIIDRAELQKRLNITETTIIRWQKKGKIPAMRIGASVRYNWPVVVEALSQKKGNRI